MMSRTDKGAAPQEDTVVPREGWEREIKRERERERESVCVCACWDGGHVCACVWEPSSRWTNGCAGIEWAEAMEAGRSGVSGGRLWYGGAVSLRAGADGQREARSFDTSMSRAGVSWGILRSFSKVSWGILGYPGYPALFRYVSSLKGGAPDLLKCVHCLGETLDSHAHMQVGRCGA